MGKLANYTDDAFGPDQVILYFVLVDILARPIFLINIFNMSGKLF